MGRNTRLVSVGPDAPPHQDDLRVEKTALAKNVCKPRSVTSGNWKEKNLA